MPTKSTDGLILKLSITITHCYNKMRRFSNEKQREWNHANSTNYHNNCNVDFYA